MALEKATLAGGCFWCTEAIFKRLKGVTSVIPGYAASQVENPSYREVCSGKTGAAEAIQITYDPSVISYQTLLEIFWHLHDPTTLNRQGNDIGTQYRSAIYYHNDEQKHIALVSQISMRQKTTTRITMIKTVSSLIAHL
jgi:peptide-methionine (S)-S-oxide reductase